MATRLDTERQAIIDGYLESFEREMRWAVVLASTWDTAEEIERSDLVAEWALIMDFYITLLKYEREQQLSPVHQHRFDAIRDFFKGHESLLAGVLGSDWVTTEPVESWFV